jgi:Protein kinase domain
MYFKIRPFGAGVAHTVYRAYVESLSSTTGGRHSDERRPFFVDPLRRFFFLEHGIVSHQNRHSPPLPHSSFVFFFMSFLHLARQASKSKGSASVALSIAASSFGYCEYSRSQQQGKENESSSSSSDENTRWTSLLDRAIPSPRVLCDRASGDGLDSTLVMASSAAASVAAGGPSDRNHNPFTLRRRATLARMNLHSTKHALETKYEINPEPIGEGAFGQVFVARHRQTGELVAVKRIWKKYSDNQDFVREMSTLLQIQAHGGHPHICQLRENFEQADDYALVLDLIKGGEMFEHLVESGAYSELDGKFVVC